MSKRSRTLDSFFACPPTKKSRAEGNDGNSGANDISEDQHLDVSGVDTAMLSAHSTYPYAIPHLPIEVFNVLNFAPEAEARVINDQPDLDLVYYQPYVPKDAHRALFDFLRLNLFFYRVKYMIKRGTLETQINTPRFTTVFGLDDTCHFNSEGRIVESTSGKPAANGAYKCKPRPLPQALDLLRTLTENATGCKFNFALVNYYASGSDSISFHSDDERFLGVEPAIASFTLGAKRDFLLKHKPTPAGHISETKAMKLPLASGDMILMKGMTQSKWLHSIPKRKGGEADRGRINITFRRAMVKGGTENYYRYNVGDGEVYKWCASRHEMQLWTNG